MENLNSKLQLHDLLKFVTFIALMASTINKILKVFKKAHTVSSWEKKTATHFI
jgi:hypothetical protein